MQVFVVFQRVLLAALAVSAAKLPLPSPVGPTQGVIGTHGNSGANIVPVPSQLSTLYDAPLADLPVPAQSTIVIQTPVELSPVPAELSTLYEAPVEDIPSVAQPTLLVQIPVETVPVTDELPDLYEIPAEDLPAPDQQSAFVQIPVDIVPVPAEPTHLYELPVDNLPAPAQQSTVNIVPVPAEPSNLYDIPFETLPASTQQLNVAQTPAVLFVADHSVLNDTPAVPVAVPNEPSISYEISEEAIQAGNEFPTIVQIPQVAVLATQEPSNLYEPPSGVPSSLVVPSFAPGIQEQSVPAASFDTPEVSLAVPAVSSVLSQVPTEVNLASPEPAVLYDTPSEDFPVTDTFSFVHSVPQQVVNEPEELYETPNQPIQFPEQTHIQGPTFIDLVQVPAVPSTLYGIPEEEIPLPSSQFGSGKAMTSSNEIQSDFETNPSSLYEVPAAASSPVASVAKGGMMVGMPYNFQWGVDDSESGNAFTHYENSDGQSTSGQYRVTLPDGRIQVVNFYDNGDGFHADVTYE